jgi:formate/nitrite transporter FocA (FNT family)
MADSDDDDRKAANAKELHRTVREDGQDELDRPAIQLFWSGLAAGLAITASLVTEGALQAGLPPAPWRELIVSLGYPLGFLLVILGRMQFFTESTITAVLPLATSPSWTALRKTLRIWGIVLGANLLGTLLASAAIAHGLLGTPELHAQMTEISAKIAELSPGATFLGAVPAGFLIAIVAWTLPNAREQSVLVIFAIVYLVAIGGFSHSVVGSLEAFLLMWDGRVGAGEAVFGLILPAVAGNLVGGGGIFALLAHGQVRGEMKERADGQGQED